MSLGAELLALAPRAMVIHAPALVVVAPLLLGVAAAAIPSARVALWIFRFVSVFSTLCAAVILARIEAEGGPIRYAFSGFTSPLGIEYRLDTLSATIVFLVSAMGAVCAFVGPALVDHQIPLQKRSLFYSAFMVCFAGLIGLATTGDAFNLFVFLEISSLSTYVLVGMGGLTDRRAYTAAFNYLVLGTIGATFYVIGIGFIYAATGTLNMLDIAERLQTIEDSRTVKAAFAFIVIGLGLKAAMFPLHTWLPNAYSYAPSIVSVFLAATATKVALYTIIRFLFTVFSPEFAYEGVTLVWILAPLAILAMIWASAQAVFQTDVRQLLAYSSLAQVGYILLGLSLATTAGVSAGVLHILNHAVMKGALFLAVGAIVLRLGITQIADFRGLGRRMPATMIAFTISALSLVGVPLTAGFVSKLALLQAVLAAGWWWALIPIAISSVLAFVYVGRVLECAYLRPAAAPETGASATAAAAPLTLVAALWVLALANIALGVNADLPAGLASAAAVGILGGDGLGVLTGVLGGEG